MRRSDGETSDTKKVDDAIANLLTAAKRLRVDGPLVNKKTTIGI